MIKCGKCKKEYGAEKDFFSGTYGWRLDAKSAALGFRCGCGQRLTLDKGAMSIYAPDLAIKKGSVFNLLVNNKIPRLSPFAASIRASLLNNSVEIHKIIELFRKEPVIAARVLGLANMFRRTDGPKLTSIEHAVAFVGRQTVADMVIVTELSSFKLATKGFSSELFLRTALASGVVTEFLGSRFGDGSFSTDEAYLGGALAGIGRLVQALAHPAETDELVEIMKSNVTKVSWEKGERLANLPSSASLGDLGTAIWGIENLDHKIFKYNSLQELRAKGELPSAGKMTIVECVGYAMAITPMLIGAKKNADMDLVNDLGKRCGLTVDKLNEMIVEIDLSYSSKVPKTVPLKGAA